MSFHPLHQSLDPDSSRNTVSNRLSQSTIVPYHDSATEPLIPRVPSRQPPPPPPPPPPGLYSQTKTISDEVLGSPQTPIMQRPRPRLRRRLAIPKPESSTSDSEGLLFDDIDPNSSAEFGHFDRYPAFPKSLSNTDNTTLSSISPSHSRPYASKPSSQKSPERGFLRRYNSYATAPTWRHAALGLGRQPLPATYGIPGSSCSSDPDKIADDQQVTIGGLAKSQTLGQRTLKRGNDWASSVSKAIHNIGHASSGDSRYTIPKGFRLSSSGDTWSVGLGQGSGFSTTNQLSSSSGRSTDMAGLGDEEDDDTNDVDYLYVSKPTIRRPAKIGRSRPGSQPNAEAKVATARGGAVKSPPGRQGRSLRKVTASFFNRIRGSSSQETDSDLPSTPTRLYGESLRNAISGHNEKNPHSTKKRSRSSSNWGGFGTLLRRNTIKHSHTMPDIFQLECSESLLDGSNVDSKTEAHFATMSHEVVDVDPLHLAEKPRSSTFGKINVMSLLNNVNQQMSVMPSPLPMNDYTHTTQNSTFHHGQSAPTIPVVTTTSDHYDNMVPQYHAAQPLYYGMPNYAPLSGGHMGNTNVASKGVEPVVYAPVQSNTRAMYRSPQHHIYPSYTFSQPNGCYDWRPTANDYQPGRHSKFWLPHSTSGPTQYHPNHPNHPIGPGIQETEQPQQRSRSINYSWLLHPVSTIRDHSRKRHSVQECTTTTVISYPTGNVRQVDDARRIPQSFVDILNSDLEQVNVLDELRIACDNLEPGMSWTPEIRVSTVGLVAPRPKYISRTVNLEHMTVQAEYDIKLFNTSEGRHAVERDIKRRRVEVANH